MTVDSSFRPACNRNGGASSSAVSTLAASTPDSEVTVTPKLGTSMSSSASISKRREIGSPVWTASAVSPSIRAEQKRACPLPWCTLWRKSMVSPTRGKYAVERQVLRDDLAWCADVEHAAPVEQDARVAELCRDVEVVADEDHRPAGSGHLADLAETFLLEPDIANGEDLVDDQDLGLEVRRHGEGHPHVHADRVVLDRRVDEALELGEGDDLVDLAADLASGHAEDGAVQVDVLESGQFGMEAGADLEQRADPALQQDLAARRLGDAGDDLEQGRLSCTVAPDQAEHRALGDVGSSRHGAPTSPLELLSASGARQGGEPRSR